MATPVEIIDKQVSTEGKKLDEKYIKIGIYTIVAFVIVTIVLFACYRWEYPFWEFDYPIDAERWGQFGDFYGGVLGTIITFVSIVFVYMAFKEQRLANIEAHAANAEMIKQTIAANERDNDHIYFEWVQQFDSNFKTLMDLYMEAVNGYKTPSDTIPSGKASLNNLVSSFIASTTFESHEGYTKNAEKAVIHFNDFFTKHMTVINAHMRLLYQIFNLLDSNSIDEDDKILYAKTLRSQLTDEELILIRYNCMTKRGRKMQIPVFHYNILKHLPLLGLLEFKKYRKGLSNAQINLLNDELVSLRKELCELFLRQSESNKCISQRTYGNRYTINASVTKDNSNYTFTVVKKPKVHGRRYDQMISIFDNYSEDDLEKLLLGFHTELFRHGHFRIYNRNSKFLITHKVKQVDNDFVITIKAHNDVPIIVSYFQIKDPQ